MTPLEIKICLHYSTSSEQMPWVSSGAPIVEATMQGLIGVGLITAERFADLPWVYKPTEKLAAYVEMLCSTPMPKLCFIDPRTKLEISLP